MAAPGTGSADRLGVTLLFSLIAHGVLALGLTFEYEKPAPQLPSLDVILVQSANGEKPDKADFLAQANNSGGGTADEARCGRRSRCPARFPRRSPASRRCSSRTARRGRKRRPTSSC